MSHVIQLPPPPPDGDNVVAMHSWIQQELWPYILRTDAYHDALYERLTFIKDIAISDNPSDEIINSDTISRALKRADISFKAKIGPP